MRMLRSACTWKLPVVNAVAPASQRHLRLLDAVLDVGGVVEHELRAPLLRVQVGHLRSVVAHDARRGGLPAERAAAVVAVLQRVVHDGCPVGVALHHQRLIQPQQHPYLRAAAEAAAGFVLHVHAAALHRLGHIPHLGIGHGLVGVRNHAQVRVVVAAHQRDVAGYLLEVLGEVGVEHPPEQRAGHRLPRVDQRLRVGPCGVVGQYLRQAMPGGLADDKDLVRSR